MRYFVGDFETTSYEGQTRTEVWASAIVELNTDNVVVANCIEDTWLYLNSFRDKIIVFYHNLKFDGSFWINFLYSIGYTEATWTPDRHEEKSIITDEMFKDKTPNIKFSSRLKAGQLTYMISSMGQWYTIRVKTPTVEIEFRDSLKLIPLSVEAIGKSFGTKHKKAVDDHGKSIEYNKFRKSGGEITDTEITYIKNDVLVVKEALEIMFNEGHDKMTIGSCCMEEYKPIYKELFGISLENRVQELFNTHIRVLKEGSEDEKWYKLNAHTEEERHSIFMNRIYVNLYDYVKESYRGGWVYLAKGCEQKIYNNGITLDVNSLYPSVMHSDLGYKYPVRYIGQWHGNYIPEIAQGDETYYFIRFRTRFFLKDGYLPTVQIKRNPLYPPREMLETSDVYDKKYKVHYRYEYPDGTKVEPPILTMTESDYILFREHYYVEDFEILDGLMFEAKIGIFDAYINKYAEMKRNAKTPGRRQIAKLYLNNLYGKMAANTDSSFKMAYLNDDNALSFHTINEYDKKPGYIPIGSAITSYARCFTIRAAQKNYYGADKPGFKYADTDSLHMDLSINDVKGVTIDDVNFGCWKHESSWDTGYFVRAKTYIECESNKINITCAGLPKRCKRLLEMSISGDIDQEFDFTEEEKVFVNEKRELTDFAPGIVIPGKLLPKQIPGGVVLQSTTFEMT